jgi:hypothetical protein
MVQGLILTLAPLAQNSEALPGSQPGVGVQEEYFLLARSYVNESEFCVSQYSCRVSSFHHPLSTC